MTDKKVRERCADCLYCIQKHTCKYFCTEHNKPCNEIENCSFEDNSK